MSERSVGRHGWCGCLGRYRLAAARPRRRCVDRTGAAARLLLRRAERLDGPGALLIAAHPAVLAAIAPEWRDALTRRTGRQLRWEAEPAIALEAGYAQLVSL